MTQNLENRFTMTQNKVLGPFIFLKVVPKILFWGQIWSRTLNFVPKISVFGKFGPETSKCFV